MDSLDALILRELSYHPADPHHAARGLRRPWDTARALGLHGTTVKRRIADLREHGVLRTVYLQPAAALVGRRTSEHVFRYPDTARKQRALDHLFDDPSVWEVYGLVGKELVAVIATPDSEDVFATTSRLGRDTGAAEVRYHHDNSWAVDVNRVSALDLRILAAFADDALRSVGDVAAEVGIAPKTVTNRMRALTVARAFRVHPNIDYTRLPGGVTVYLDVQLETGFADVVHTELANRFPTAACRSRRGAENAYVVTYISATTELEEAVSRAETIPGVREVTTSIVGDTRGEPTRWKDALLARAEELARAKGIWAPSWRATPDAISR